MPEIDFSSEVVNIYHELDILIRQLKLNTGIVFVNVKTKTIA